MKPTVLAYSLYRVSCSHIHSLSSVKTTLERFHPRQALFVCKEYKGKRVMLVKKTITLSPKNDTSGVPQY